MKYNFDEIIDRKNTNSQNVEGWRSYIFKCGPDKKFPYADDEFIRMWIADMDFAVAPEIRQAIKDRVDKKILGYTGVYDSDYYDAFHKWCLDNYDWIFPKEELTFSQGIIPALYQLIEDLVKPCNGKVLTMTPAYSHFLHACTYNQVQLVCSPLQKKDSGFEIDFDDFDKKASDPDVKMLMLCNPHNPTGRVWTESELQHIAQTCEKYGLWIVSDEIHCDLLRTGLKHIPLGKIMTDYDRLVTCMSASKTFNLAGLCFSDIIIRNAEERKRFVARDKTRSAINPLSLAAHQAAYQEGAQWLSELKAYIDGNLNFVKEFLEENIPSASFRMPEATYFAWIDFGNTLPDEENLSLFFANKAGVLLESGDSLFVSNAQGYVRLNLAMPRSMVKLGMERIAEAISSS